MRRRLLVLFTIVLASCTTTPTARGPGGSNAAHSSTVPTAPRPSPAKLDCSDPIATSPALQSGFEDIDGVIGLQTTAVDPVALQTSESGTGDPATRLFAKTAIQVRTDASAEIHVPPDAAASVQFDWGNTAPRTRTADLTIGPCTGPPGAWLTYPGGYYVPDPSCVEIAVRTGESDRTVTIGVGAPCPGQQPPPAPTGS